ncbi:MAG: TonB-dependent receptor [Gemmatimonadetes bacterium]|nr:TonB-dependent receptor [Gemmatimonadota bacterium]
MLQDYRFAGVPSLRVNVPLLFTGSNEDIERVELLLGPASALYGPNSGNGVLHVITKSPFESQGTTVTVDGGERSIFRAAFRHAGVLNDKVGYKISGETFTGSDWRYVDPAEPVTFDTAQRVPLDRRGTAAFRDYGVKKQTIEGRLDLRPIKDLTLISTVGYTEIPSGMELTGANGTSMVRNWSYTSFQERINYKRFFGQVFMNESNAGNNSPLSSNGTYLLRSGQPIVDQSRVVAAQAIQGIDWGANQTFTIGGDFIWTNPRTAGTTNGANENADNVKEIGAFIQSETKLSSRWDLILAGRVDKHSAIDETMFSPRAALVFRPAKDQTLRVSYNRAFSTPANFSFFLDLISSPNIGGSGFDLRAEGNPPKQGWNFRSTCGGPNGGFCMRSPFVGGNQFVASSGASALPGLWARNATNIRNGVTSAIAAGFTPSFGAAIGGALGAAVGQAVSATLPTLAPTDALVPSRLAFLSSATTPINPASLGPIAPLKAQYNQNFELGYKGIAFGNIRFDASFWYQQRGDVGTSASLATPSVFVDATQAKAFLASNGTLIANVAAALTPIYTNVAAGGGFGAGCTGAAAATCGGLAANGTLTGFPQLGAPAIVGSLAASFYGATPGSVGSLGGAPLGTVTFDSPKINDGSLLATYQAVTTKTIDVFGLDFSGEYQVNRRLTTLGTISWMNKNVFDDLGPIGGNNLPIMSNSPKLKGSFTVRFADQEEGWSTEARVRAWSGYAINSGVYASGVGFAIPAGNPGFVSGAVAGVGRTGPGLYTYDPVSRTGVLDLSASYRFKNEGSFPITLSISATNVLDQAYTTFAGAPAIGRLVMTRLTTTF